MIKTYKDWNCSLSDYLQVGDVVDIEMYNHFLNVLPPATNQSNLVQVGEPYSISKDNKNIYLTLEKIDGEWTYKGHCHRGENIHQESMY